MAGLVPATHEHPCCGEIMGRRHKAGDDERSREANMTTIAFIGVGNMGGPMARNLLKAQDKVRAFDLSPAALKPVTDADVVVTMLPAGSHVRSVYLEGESVLTAARKDALLIDCSTIDIDSARAVHM